MCVEMTMETDNKALSLESSPYSNAKFCELPKET